MKAQLSYSVGFHPDGRELEVSAEMADRPAGFAMVVLSLAPGTNPTQVATPVGPVEVPSLGVAMSAFDGRYSLRGGPGILGVDETLHALVGGIAILAGSLPKSDPRQAWCADVHQMFMLMAAGAKRAPVIPDRAVH